MFGRVIVEAEVLRMMLYGLALVLVMLYRPKGLWPAPEHGINPVVSRHSRLVA
jgi:branched-chain amino acid transport system permease protein